MVPDVVLPNCRNTVALNRPFRAPLTCRVICDPSRHLNRNHMNARVYIQTGRHTKPASNINPPAGFILTKTQILS